MGIFSRFFEPRRTDSTRFEHLESKVRILDDVQEKQGRALKALELEWEQTYDKMSHLMARITKRRAALDREQQAQEQAPQGTGHENGREAGPTPVNSIIGTHDALQEMRRRNGLLPR
jgi:hypothetical protein